MHRSLFRRAALAACMLGPLPLHAAGTLDPGFGGGLGFVQLPLGVGSESDDRLFDIQIDSAGRLLVAGWRSDTSGVEVVQDFALARLLPNGVLDPAFASGGALAISFGGSDQAQSVFETANQRYVVCGASSGPGAGAWALARVLANGAPDTSFDFDGRRLLSLPAPDGSGPGPLIGGDCAAAAAGGIVIAGAMYISGGTEAVAAVARLHADGSLDEGFNATGYRLFDATDSVPRTSAVSDLLVEADGSMLLAGFANNGDGVAPNLDLFVARLRADGSLDPDFGNQGIQLVAFDQGGSNGDISGDLVRQPDGKLLLSGTSDTAGGGLDVALVRLLPNGTPDASFGTSGRALFGYDGGGDLLDSGTGAALDQDGRILVSAMVSEAPGDTRAAVLRVQPTGVIDASYGEGGWFVLSSGDAALSHFEAADAVVVDASGRAIAAGSMAQPGTGGVNGLVLRLTSERVFGDGFEPLP